jgi:hypothetical protein
VSTAASRVGLKVRTCPRRGVDVVNIDGGGVTGKKVKAPVRQQWFGSPTADSTSFQPHPDYGFMCPLLKPDVDTR